MDDYSRPRRVWLLTAADRASEIQQHLRDAHLLDKRNGVAYYPSLVDYITFSPVQNLESPWIAAVPTRIQSYVWQRASPQPELSLASELRAKIKDRGIVIAIRRREPLTWRKWSMARGRQNRLREIVQQWLENLGSDVRALLPCYPDDLLRGAWRYGIYPPMLVLSPSNFASAPWKLCGPVLNRHVDDLFQAISAQMRVTHVALSAPIPFYNPDTVALPGTPVPNVRRTPCQFSGVFGDFGDPKDPPDEEGFQRALWATACQFGLHQVFAPLHTMFAKGNVSEKGRILKEFGLRPGGNVTAVDLYAGIGYFAFPYAKAGAERVLCWEINPWSVEGFRRGAEKNRFKTRVVQAPGEFVALEEACEGPDGEASLEADPRGPQLWMFHQNNRGALSCITLLRDKIPPITHVNCGYLPSSQAVWWDALQILDPEAEGMIYAHENVAVVDIMERSQEVEALMNGYLKKLPKEPRERIAMVKHQQVVKKFAPGVVHVVFDIYVG